METLLSVLPYIQIILAVLLTGAILMQQRGAGLGSAFGGGEDGTVHYERRGAEKTFFQATIIIAILFVISIIIPLITKTSTIPTAVNTAQTEKASESETDKNILDKIEVTGENGETIEVEPENTLDIPTE